MPSPYYLFIPLAEGGQKTPDRSLGDVVRSHARARDRESEGQDKKGAPRRLVSLAAVFWTSRNAPPKEWGALRDIQKTAARETTRGFTACSSVLPQVASLATRNGNFFAGYVLAQDGLPRASFFVLARPFCCPFKRLSHRIYM